MNKLQQIELNIALEVKKICDSNNISYFIDFGTLLGSIRHKGFIPWDDDFDFSMLRSDYEKFIAIAPGLLPNYLFLQTYHSDNEYGLPFAKVRMNNSVFLESSFKFSKAHKGIYVDIFPYDNCPSNKDEYNIFKIKLIYYSTILKIKSNVRPWYYKKFSFITYLKYLPFIIIAMFYKRKNLISKYESVARKYETTKEKFVILNDSNMVNIKPISKLFYTELYNCKFENYIFKAPVNYDELLRLYYGDYMIIPDEKDRLSTHDVIKVLFNDKEM